MRTVRPDCELLEAREVPAVTALFRSGVLYLTGTEASEAITVRQVNGRITADGTNVSLPATSISRIQIDARGGNDRILLNSETLAGQQAIRKPATILGGNGNDTIVGGYAADYIHGGAGNDSVWGNAGNDRIYGGTGTDTLRGEAGLDGLFGGYGADTLSGGNGSDRFLLGGYLDSTGTFVTYSDGDALPDFATGTDVWLGFADDTRNWSDAEVERLDGGLAALHNRASNTRLLLTAAGANEIFVRKSVSEFNPGLSTADNDGRGTINVYDGGLYYSDGTAVSAGIVSHLLVHEFGHNWDEAGENGGIDQFRALSDWQEFNPGGYTKAPTTAWGDWWYSPNAGFISDYARNNPLEDFSETFAVAILGQLRSDVSAAAAPDKVNWVNGWLNSLR